MEQEQFDGVFKFTNASDKEFIFRWNNKDYIFPPMSTSPLIMPNFTLEEVQAIRKKAALKYAQREFDRSEQGQVIAREGNKHLSPATYDLSVLQPYVDQCLNPLPISRATVIEVPLNPIEFKDGGTAIIGQGSSIDGLSSPTGAFKDYTPPTLGAMSDSA